MTLRLLIPGILGLELTLDRSLLAPSPEVVPRRPARPSPSLRVLDGGRAA